MKILCYKPIALCFLLIVFIASGARCEWLDSCNDDISRYSYDYQDIVCSVKAALGYSITDTMKLDSFVGYFEPEIKVRQGTAWYVFGDLSCSHMGGPTTLRYNAMGGTWEVGAWVFQYVFPAGVCVRLEEVRSTPYDPSEITSVQGCVDGLPDRDDFMNARGRFGADYPGQLALCAYTTSYLVDATWCHDMANTLKIKCLKLPQAPPPPPFCKMIMSAEKVNMVYLKPDNIAGVNTYFTPAARLVYTVSKKTCDSGIIQDPSVPCADGSTGVTNTDKQSANVAGVVSGGHLPYDQKHTVSLGGKSYYLFMTVLVDTVCAEGSFSDAGTREFLGCVPRTMPTTPMMDLYGSLGETAATDNLLMRITFNYSPPDTPFVELKPVSSQQIADAIQNNALYPPTIADYYDMQLSVSRINFQTHEEEAEAIMPTKICRASNGVYGVYPADEKCDVSTNITRVTKIMCSNGAIVDSVSQCSGGTGVSTEVKQCSPGKYVDVNSACDLGKTVYDDDVEGRKICLQGMLYEEELLFILREDNEGNEVRKYFKKNPRMLIPMKVENNALVVDYSKSPVDYNSLSQDTLDTMLYNPSGGYYKIKIDSSEGTYIFAVKTEKTSDGKETYYSDADTGQPFFVDQNEMEYVLPADPLKRGMCIDIPTDNLPPQQSFDQIFNHPAIYTSHHLKHVPYSSDAQNGGWNWHFHDPVYDEQTGTVLPRNTMAHTKGFDFTDQYASHTPFPPGYDAHSPEDIPWAGSANSIDNDYSTNDLRSLMLGYEGYFVHDTIDPKGCSSLTFELWGAGSRGRGDSMTAGANDWTFDFTLDGTQGGGGRSGLCDKGCAGESGAYVKGQMNLKRGSKIAVIVGRACDAENTVCAGSALWIADEGEPFKLIAYAKSGDMDHPRHMNVNDLSAYYAPGQFAPYNGILDPNVFWTRDCGTVAWDYPYMPGIYHRINGIQFDKERARMYEYRHRQGSTFCGRSGGGRLSETSPMTGPIVMVDSAGNERAATVNANLKQNIPDTDVRRIGTWPFIMKAQKDTGDDGTKCNQIIPDIYGVNTQSKLCLQFACKVTCSNMRHSRDHEQPYEAVPSEHCSGLGGGFLTETPLVRSRRNDWGNHGYVRLVCR